MPRVSIIVPIYNAENYLDKCVHSIVNQKHTDIEIILVNDGSTDKSLSICRKYSEIDNRVIVINKGNGGVATARNVGIDIATGDYIAFVDSDDYIHPMMYKDLLNCAEKHDADIVECGFYHVSNDKIIFEKQFEQGCTIGNINSSLNLIKNKNTTNSIWNKLYKATLIGDTRFPAYSYSEDYYFNSILAYKCKLKYTVNKEYYYYNLVDGSVMRSPFSNNNLDQIKARIEMFNFFKNKQDFELIAIYVALDILVCIVRLYFKMLETNNIKKDDYIKFFNNEFNNYIKYVPKSLINNTKPIRIRVGIKLLDFNQKVFQYTMSLYINMRKVMCSN